MPTFVFKAPDGRTAEVVAPEGTTEAEAFAVAQQQMQPQAAPAERQFVGPVANVAEQTRADAISQARGEAAGAQAVGQGIRNLGQGLRQTVSEGLETIGVLPKGTTQRYTDRVLEQRQALTTELLRDGVRPQQIEALQTVGETLPLLFTPAVRAASVTGSLIKNALLGGTVAGSVTTEQNVADESRLGTMAKGAAAGALIGLVPGLMVGSWNYVTRSARNLLGGPQAVANAAALDELGIQRYSIGQQTGDPSMIGLEAAVNGPNKAAMLFQQAETVKQRFADYVARLGGRQSSRGALETAGPQSPTTAPRTPVPLSRAAQARAVRDQLAAREAELSTAKDSLWTTGIKRVQAVAGDSPLLKPGSLLRKVNEIIADQNNVRRNPTSTAVSKQFEAYREELTRMSQEGATAKELNDLLVGINDVASGRSKIFTEGTEAANQQMAASMRAALFDDIGALAGQQSPAVDLLLAVRAGYRQMSQAQDDLADSALAAAFGKKQAPRPKEMASFLRSADPEDQAALVSLLQRADPTALRAVRAEAAQAAWKAAFNPNAPAARSAFDIGKFNAELQKLGESGLFNAGQRAKILSTMNGVRVLLNRVEGGLGNAPAIMPDDVSINAFSRNAGFIARLIVQKTQGGQLDDLLFTEAGQQAIRVLARTGSTSAQLNAAAATLIGLSDRTEEPSNVPQQ